MNVQVALVAVLIVLTVGINAQETCDFGLGEYSCVPCGGIYYCYGTSTCTATEVDDCSLPGSATHWQCCQTASCNVQSAYVCYTGSSAVWIWWVVIIGMILLCCGCFVVLFVILRTIKAKKAQTTFVQQQTSYSTQPYTPSYAQPAQPYAAQPYTAQPYTNAV